MLAQVAEILPQLDADHCVDSVLQWPSTHIHKFIDGMRETLRDICKQLSLDVDRVIVFDAAQDNVNKIADLKHLRTVLRNAQETAISVRNSVDVQQKIELRMASVASHLPAEKTAAAAEADQIPVADLKARIEKELAIFQKIDIPASDLRLDESLGAGGFGTVARAIRLSSGEILAVKEVRSDNLTMATWASLYSELAVMADLHHRYVLELVGAHIHEPYRIVTRFAAGKSLFDRMHKPGAVPISPLKMTAIAYQVAVGMAYLRELRIVHRDLKTMNILLDDDDNAKIADFGLAGSVTEEGKLSGRVGTPHYTAPEVLEGKDYGPKVDVYSYGIMLWEMATAQIPYVNKTHEEICDLVIGKNWRLPFTSNVSEDLKKLISACWSRNPADRPEFREIAAQFRTCALLLPGCKSITPEQLDPPEPCPPLDEPYLIQTLKTPSSPQFPSIVQFLAEHIDEKVRAKLRAAHILNGLTSDSPNAESILILASEVLDEGSFKAFFESTGHKMFDSLLARKNPSSVVAVVRFCLRAPRSAQGLVLPFLPAIVKHIESDQAGPFIIRLLATIPVEKSMKFRTQILRFFTGHGLDDITRESEIAAVAKLLPLFVESMSPADLHRFVAVLERGFDIPLSLVTLLIQWTHADALTGLAVAVIRASERTDLSEPLAEILRKCTPADIARIAGYAGVFDVTARLLTQSRLVDVALLLFFYLACVPSVPAHIAQHPCLDALLSLKGHEPQRLQIFTALVQSEEFCKKTTSIEGIGKLITSSISREHISEYCLLLIGALSSTRTGCELVHSTGMVNLFSHMFLSSNVADTTTAYAILRNLARYQSEIPQISVIVSCILQDLLYHGPEKAEILITLTQLVTLSPDCIQDTDLQNSVLPLITGRTEGRDSAVTITLALQLLSACETSKLGSFHQKLAQKTADVLSKEGLRYPELITAAAVLISSLAADFDLRSFLQSTDIVNFFLGAQQQITSEFPALSQTLNQALDRLRGGGRGLTKSLG
jgi:serine/threonine protein kinase